MCSLPRPLVRSRRCQSYQTCDLLLNSSAALSPMRYGIFASSYHLLHILNWKTTEYIRSQGISRPHKLQLFSPNLALMAKFHLAFTMKHSQQLNSDYYHMFVWKLGISPILGLPGTRKKLTNWSKELQIHEEV